MEREVKNTPQVEKFLKLAEQKDYNAVNEMLKNGFNPNCRIEFEDFYSYDNGAITGSCILTAKLLDYYEDNLPMIKLLRHYGARTSEEDYATERRRNEKQRQEKLEKDLAFIDSLLNS